MHLQFLGCGDAFGSGGRFNTCFHVDSGDGAFLIDCGATSMVALRRWDVDPNGVQAIFVSHLHGDHFGGLPFFILDAQFYSRRTAPLTIVGPPGLTARLSAAQELFFPGSAAAQRLFATVPVELEPGIRQEFGTVAATGFEVSHACGAPPLALRLECMGRTIAYSGDTEWTDSLIDAASGADLFIVEALTYDRRIQQHLDYATWRRERDRIGAKRTILTHLGPEMLARAPDVSDVEIAEDGLLIPL